jgi:8-oxo-dGTP pyrophosphatase MutT (NUDIX family)
MGKFRILVKGIVTREDDFLIVERWYDDRVVDPYQWEFLDGVMEFGEAPDEAVLRLVSEKTGLSVDIDRVLYTWGFTAGEICTIGLAYQLTSKKTEVTLSDEYPNYKWVPKDELEKHIKNKSILNDIERIGLTDDFNFEEFGEVGKFIESLD